SAEQCHRSVQLPHHLADDVDRLVLQLVELVPAVEARALGGVRRRAPVGGGGQCRGHVWIPHSVLVRPAHRPDRGSSPGATRRVHGSQPMLGYPAPSRGLTGTRCSSAWANTWSKVHCAKGLILTNRWVRSQLTRGVRARSGLSSRRTPVTQAS